MKDEPRSDRLAFRVLNNSAVSIGGEVFYRLVSFFSGILIARSLGTEDYGQFSFIFVYLWFFEVFVYFGLNSILARELARREEEGPRILGTALLFRLALIASALPVSIFLIGFLGYPLSVRQGVLIASFQLFLTLRTIYETVFRVRLLMVYPALWNGLRALVNLGFVAAVASTRPALPNFIFASLASGLLCLAGMAVFTRRFVRIRFEWDWGLVKGFVRESAPLMFAGYLTVLYYRIDIFMLSAMKGFKDIGYYSVATRITESLDVIATAVMVSVFPLLARAFKSDRKEFDYLIARTFRGLLLVGLPMALGGSLVAPDLIQLVFGKEYAPSGVTLAILFWYTFFGFFSTFLVNILIVCGRQVVDAWVSLGLTLCNVAVNFLLIPAYSYNGAALATVLTEIFGTLAMLVYASRHPAIRLSFPLSELGSALKVNGPFLALLLALKFFFQIPVIGFVLLGLGAYLLLLVGMKLIRLSDLKGYLAYGKKLVSGARP